MTDQNQRPDSATPAELEDDSRNAIWQDFDDDERGRGDDDDQHDKGADGGDDYETGSSDWSDGSDDGDDDQPDDDGQDEDETASTERGDESPEAQIERLKRALDSEKGRSKGQQRANEAARREIEELKTQIARAEASAPRSGVDDAAQKRRREQLAAAQEDYGDVIGPLVETIGDLEARVSELNAKEVKALERQKARLGELYDAEERTFTTEHPDGFDALRDNWTAFNGWIEDQPKATRDIFAANSTHITDGQQAAYLVSLFKQSLGQAQNAAPDPTQNRSDRVAARRQSQLEGSRTTRSQAATRPGTRPSADASPEASWEYFERLDAKKKRDGR